MMRHPRLRRGLNLALLAALAWLPLATLTTGTAEANHSQGFYLSPIRWVEYKETFCVEAVESSLPLADAHARVNAALTWENPDQDWYGLNNWKIEFEDANFGTGLSCNGLRDHPTFPLDEEVEIRYWVMDDRYNPLVCGGPSDPNSCAVRDESGMSWNNGIEWQRFNVYLRTENMQWDDYGDPDRRRHAVNHETGHVFGLDDGGPYAYNSQDRSCPQSIMHPFYYGCDGSTPERTYVPRYPWPQGIDFATVINHTEGR